MHSQVHHSTKEDTNGAAREALQLDATRTGGKQSRRESRDRRKRSHACGGPRRGHRSPPVRHRSHRPPHGGRAPCSQTRRRSYTLQASGHVSLRERPGLAGRIGDSARGLQDRSRLHGTSCGAKGRGEKGEKTHNNVHTVTYLLLIT